MNKILIACAAGLGLSVIVSAALASPGRDGAHWDRLDTNKDGKITAEELSSAHADLIEKADSNGDGAISKEEMKAHHKARHEEMRAKHNPDKNGDNVVDHTEFMNAAQERFDHMDKDGNGVLSEDELQRKKHHRGHRRHHEKG